MKWNQINSPPKALPKLLDILQIKVFHKSITQCPVDGKKKPNQNQKPKGVFTQMKSLFPTAAVIVA